MARPLTAFLLLAAAAARAEEWVIRSPQVVPTSGTGLQTASTVHGALAVWSQHWSRRGVLVQPGAAGVTMPFQMPPLFASDGQDYLGVAGGSEAATLIRGDTGERIALDRRWWKDVRPRALAWSGRAYVLIFQRTGYDNFAILLNRRGEPVSGELVAGWGEEVQVACSGSACALAVKSWRSGQRAGVIAESDFPLLGGRSKRVVLPHSPGRIVRLAADAGGFASLQFEASRLFYQRLAPGIEQEPGDGETRRFRVAARALVAEGAPVALADRYLAALSLTLDGDTAYAGAGGRLLRIDGDRAEEIDLGEAAAEVAVALPPDGPLVLYVARANQQVRVVRLTGDTASPPRLTVSNRYAAMASPRIASGGGVHLALWTEEESVLFSILAADGSSVTAPAPLPPALWPEYSSRRPFSIASSGTTFLIVWYEERQVRGAVVGLDGTLVKPPFTVAADVWREHTTVVWHEGRYLVVADGGVVRLTSAGDVLDVRHGLAGSESQLHLASDGGKLFALDAEIGGVICTCAPTAHFDIFELDADLEPVDSLVRRRSISLWNGPVFAAGGGHRLLLWRDWSGYVALGTDGETISDYGPVQPYAPIEGAWTSREFLIAEGPRLAHHAPGGRLVRMEQLPAGTRESSVSGDAAGGIVLMVQGEPDRIIASRRP